MRLCGYCFLLLMFSIAFRICYAIAKLHLYTFIDRFFELIYSLSLFTLVCFLAAICSIRCFTLWLMWRIPPHINTHRNEEFHPDIENSNPNPNANTKHNTYTQVYRLRDTRIPTTAAVTTSPQSMNMWQTLFEERNQHSRKVKQLREEQKQSREEQKQLREELKQSREETAYWVKIACSKEQHIRPDAI